MIHMATRSAKEEPLEDWWVEEDLAPIVEACIEKAAKAPKGQKGRIYRECIKEGLSGRP